MIFDNDGVSFSLIISIKVQIISTFVSFIIMNKSNAKKRIESLRKELNEHNVSYYVRNEPVITDFEYDILMQDLIALEKKFPEFNSEESPSKRVGSDISVNSKKEFLQFPHKYPMLSLANTYNAEELYGFDERIRKVIDYSFSYNCELKFDGTAICLSYSDGKLVRALTRGDGRVGDDVTANVLTIKSIPLTIPDKRFDFEIRGEIYLPFDSFDRLNLEREEDEDQPFANPRNAASGSLKLLDPSIVKERGLQCVLYHILGENLPFEKHTEAIQWAKDQGFPVSEHSRICNNVDQIQDYISLWDEKRKFLPFATDGIVIKINELELQRKLGYTAKTPRWATAFKFKPEESLTKLISIDYQVGRTGAITPVANLEPVQLSGTVVKRASLHNSDQMELLDIHLNDYVYVEKGGEIIPKITGVELSKRDINAAKPVFPSQCPDCGSPLVKDESESKHYCTNYLNCPTQIKGRFIHFVSRKAMNILAGDATIEQLFNRGYVKQLSDLYRINKGQLLTLDGWKERSADRFLESIENSKKGSFSSVLYALGIRHIGETTAKLLVSRFHNIDSLIVATRDDLLAIEEIGDTVADSIISYFSNNDNRKLIDDLRNFGLKFEDNDLHNKILSNTLSGATIVVSGNFSSSREDIKSLISAHGGKNTGSISGNTTYLLAGEKAGSEKIKKAEKFNVKIISEEEFNNIINIQ